LSGHKPIVDTESGFVAGNYYDKYHTKNPIARWLMDGFLNAVVDLTAKVAPQDVHEIGCGEGHLTAALTAKGRRLRGSDVSEEVVAVARRAAERAGISAEFKAASIYDLNAARDGAELVVCCEVLEHLDDPQRAVKVLAKLAKPYLLTSVPREPIWRAMNMARGKYWGDFGNTPGHLQHWSKGGFLEMLKDHFEVIDVRSPLPWTVALCRSKYKL
jgi:2-polyprenyl-3-methyl-5-hydroxy-6-metoxy-1,4-benzoquinol methylase